NWPGPKGHWFWGYAGELMRKIRKDPGYYFSYIRGITKTYPYGFSSNLTPLFASLNIYHPNAVKAVLCASDAPKLKRAYRSLFEWLGHGLLVLEDKEWFRHRRLLTPSFHFEILKPYIKTMNECSITMVESWVKKTSEKAQIADDMDITPSISRMTLDTILKCLMSYESNCQDEKSTNSYVSKIYEISASVAHRMRDVNIFKRINAIFYATAHGKAFLKLCEAVHEFSDSVINCRKAELKQPLVKQNRKYLDFLDTLLKARDADGKGLSDREIRAEVDTFMFEGHDTTASGISWILYCLAENADHQEMCFREIQEQMGDRTDIEWDDLAKLPCLTMCIKESMRLFPPVPIIFRKLNKDIEVDGKLIAKGTDIVLHIYALHHHEMFWKDPEKFDPNRFLPKNSSNVEGYTYVPFSAGPRNCIGQRFAMNELKIAVAQVLRKLRISPSSDRKIQHAVDVVYKTKNGIYLRFEQRNCLT
uniref:Uncharacterized protein n=1 Tax=Ciona savignyi TaxID=51511 RepID=H2ZF41_CIOSA